MRNSDATQWSESAHDVVLDLMEVTLVNSSPYIREWMRRTSGLR
ncbi:MAG TPA: hypothetical protein VK335_26590 [Bryobacteraceae bacterium]|nr:hypothetical protein [Bryobacteraceae bacterium]